MMALPLFVHDRPDAVLAYRRGKPISARHFLSEARALAERLPAGAHVLNLCADRYLFTGGLAASLLGGKCSLLPPSHTPEAITHLRTFAPDAFCLTDDARCSVDLPKFLYTGKDASCAPADVSLQGQWSVPQIDAKQSAAYVFTSGSTGAPTPHHKTWGRLVQCVRLEAQRLPPIDAGGCAILGTVPSQHMYGFESTVLLPLQSGGVLCAERPFFPADIVASLQALPRPRVLVTTPVHLRSLLAAGVSLPQTDLIISATAMLSTNLAREVEERFEAPLLEIYGSTETGQIAARRTVHEVEWRLWHGVRLELRDERCWAQGGHIEQVTAVADILELRGEDRFVLHGRSADLVNIAGKRSSLAFLNHQLNAIPGVLDGAFFVREDAPVSLAGVTRLAALVVAPSLDTPTLLQRLRERIDPVFLPRPLLRVETLPRNETGKLPQQTLRTLIAQAAARAPHLFA
jgi:acyl-coenzyme A synthetase/AMP-(fatty) acid ligase